LISWCKNQGWQYRIRLKGNLNISHKEEGEMKTGDIVNLYEKGLSDIFFSESKVKTNIGVIYEDGHKEPWIIAMDANPNRASTLDYSERWGIEPMFSDMKSRGFNITTTQLIHEERIEVLILIITIAIYWSVSVGMEQELPKYFSKKNSKDPSHHASKLD
jgi:transposase